MADSDGLWALAAVGLALVAAHGIARHGGRRPRRHRADPADRPAGQHEPDARRRGAGGRGFLGGQRPRADVGTDRHHLESPYDVDAGDTVSFSGQVVAHNQNFPSQVGVTSAEGCRRPRRGRRAHRHPAERADLRQRRRDRTSAVSRRRARLSSVTTCTAASSADGAGPVDADVHRVQLLVGVRDAALVGRDQPAGPGRRRPRRRSSSPSVSELSPRPSPSSPSSLVGQLAGQPGVQALALGLLAGGRPPPVADPRPLGGRVALVEHVGDPAVVQRVRGLQLVRLVIGLVEVAGRLAHPTTVPPPARPGRRGGQPRGTPDGLTGLRLRHRLWLRRRHRRPVAPARPAARPRRARRSLPATTAATRRGQLQPGHEGGPGHLEQGVGGRPGQLARPR